MSASKAKRREMRSEGTDQGESYRNLAAALAVVFVLIVIAGGVYDIINNPPAFIQTSSSGGTAISPYLGEQTINESVVTIFLGLFGFLGLYLIYRSTQILYDRSKANTMILAGIGLALVGIAGSYIIYAITRG